MVYLIMWHLQMFFLDIYRVYFLSRKSDVLSVFIQFHKMVERLLGHKIKILQTDNGGEFQALKGYLSHHGIIHRLSCPHTSEQNGIVELKHCQIVESRLSMLAHAGMPLHY